MQHQPLTHAQKEKIKKREERRRRERKRLEDEYRRRIERLRRQIAEARKRRQRMFLLFLLAVLAMQESILAAFQHSFSYQPDPDPDTNDWTPDPMHDYARKRGHDDHCDGYSDEQWTRMLNERGIRVSRKAELQEAWEADPERRLFPERYKLWGHKPYLGQIMEELKYEYWRADAFLALKLLTPPEVHACLDVGYAAGSNFRSCLADRDSDIITAFQNRAVLWQERMRREIEEARKAKNEPKPDDDEKKFEP